MYLLKWRRRGARFFPIDFLFIESQNNALSFLPSMAYRSYEFVCVLGEGTTHGSWMHGWIDQCMEAQVDSLSSIYIYIWTTEKSVACGLELRFATTFFIAPFFMYDGVGQNPEGVGFPNTFRRMNNHLLTWGGGISLSEYLPFFSPLDGSCFNIYFTLIA